MFYTNYESRKGRELAGIRRWRWFFLDGIGTAGEGRGRGQPVIPCAVRGVFPGPAERKPAGGAGFAAKHGDPEPSTILEEELAALEIRYQDTDDVPCPEFWGDMRHPRCHRVLARPPQPASRPYPLLREAPEPGGLAAGPAVTLRAAKRKLVGHVNYF